MMRRPPFAVSDPPPVVRRPRPARPSQKDALSRDGCHRDEFLPNLGGDWYTEWWYFNFHDDKTGRAFFVSYLMPVGTSETGRLLAGIYGAQGARLAFATSNEVQAEANCADVRIGNCTIAALDENTYRIRGSIEALDGGPSLAWDLTLTRAGAPPVMLLDGALGRLDWEACYWMAFMPCARATGTVVVGEDAWHVEQAGAYHDHNWGQWNSLSDTWAWLQVSDPDAGFALDLGLAPCTNPSRAAVVTHQGRTWRFSEDGIGAPQLEGWQGGPWKYPQSCSVTMIDTTGTVRAEVDWTIDSVLTIPNMTLMFEEHGHATVRLLERAGEAWRPFATVESACFAEWADTWLQSSGWTSELQGGYQAEATVFGGGIAGLTAAHELVERGFRVTVVESELAMNEVGERRMALGGMARSQYARVPRSVADSGALAGLPTPDAQGDTWQDRAVTFEHASAELSQAMKESVARAVAEFVATYRPHHFRMLVRTVADTEALARARAEALRAGLLQNGMLADELRMKAETGPGDSALALESFILPGEHGFRFFPSYYRHVFDTMRRTPVYDEAGRPSGRRVLDNVLSTPVQLMIKRGIRPFFYPRTKATAGQMMRLGGTITAELDYDIRDNLQMGLRITRYLCTCKERRARLGDMTWWQFLRGWNPKTQCYLYRYSHSFTKDFTQSGRVLAAFDGRCGDARTNGSTYVQLQHPECGDPKYTDGTLNGPTTEAWFAHWKRYLEDCGVHFALGKLTRLELNATGQQERVVPWVRMGEGEERVWRSSTFLDQYFVVATDAPTAERVSAPLPLVGVPRGLSGYTTHYQDHPVWPTGPIFKRDPLRQPGLGPFDRFQTLSGMQYYFDQNFTVVPGHVYSMDAPWCLSSINQQQFWSRPRLLTRDGFGGVCSIDIGDWNTATHQGGEYLGAWNSTRAGIGAEVWRQLCVDLATPANSTWAMRLPRPRWFHIDDNIRFGERNGRTDVPVENTTPYLVPIVSDWDNRPGTEPFDPSSGTGEPQKLLDEPGVWMAQHGGYPVHWGSLVYAGIYLRTFTRQTTMESANESARHAVNAVLDHYNARHSPSPIPTGPPQPVAPRQAHPEASQTPAAFIGDYCGIWDIERYEPASYDWAKAFDRFLCRLGLPNLFILIELIPALLSHLIPYRGDFVNVVEDEGVGEPQPAWYCLPFLGANWGRKKQRNAAARAKS